MPESAAIDETLEGLDDQIRWYDIHSGRQRRAFHSLKIVTVVAAATIPLMAAMPTILPRGYPNNIVTSSLGALIVVIEGIQQLFQLQTNWILYRSTCESLKREKYLPSRLSKMIGNHLPEPVHDRVRVILEKRNTKIG